MSWRGWPRRWRPPELRWRASRTRRAAQLAETLVREQPQVVHLAGHAAFDERAGHGFWLFEDGLGHADALRGDLLAETLTMAPVRLVVLAGCESGYAGAERWAGLGQALVQAGVPLVVALQGAVSEPAAAAFTGAFYTALVQGTAVDAAIALARRAIALAMRGTDRPGEWLLPILFQRGDDAHLWPQEKARQSPPPPALAPGAITIGTLHAGQVFAGDATVTVQGGIHLPPAGDAATQQQVDALARQVAELQQALLARFDVHEQRIFTVLVKELDSHALAQAETLRQAAESGRLTDFDMTAILGALQELFVELQRHNGLLLELSRQVDLAEAEDTLVGAGANVRHRFKVTLPLLLWFLSYEGEVEWESGVDLVAALRRLFTQWRSESSAGDEP